MLAEIVISDHVLEELCSRERPCIDQPLALYRARFPAGMRRSSNPPPRMFSFARAHHSLVKQKAADKSAGASQQLTSCYFHPTASPPLSHFPRDCDRRPSHPATVPSNERTAADHSPSPVQAHPARRKCF